MAILKLARFAVRDDARTEAEVAMHAHAAYVRKELPGTSWTAYREPTGYLAVIRSDDAKADARYRDAPGTQALAVALAPLLVRPLEIGDCALVTSSDLQRRHK